MLRGGHRDLPVALPAAERVYIDRYARFFSPGALNGRRVLLYQHSAVGRDMLSDVLGALGAEVIPAGRRDDFVAIDTEAIGERELAAIQALAEKSGPVFAIVSLDGDSDRPLILGIENGSVRFYSGDLVGMIVAEYLDADGVVVPITCNDAIDRGALASVLEPKTRIGSPYVVAAMEAARKKGRKAVCGWEANGGFLVGSEIRKDGRVLSPLPTRDAFLPIVAVLASAAEKGISVAELFATLPRRFSRSGLLRHFPRENGAELVHELSRMPAAEVSRFFPAAEGFSEVESIDLTDGVRVRFSNGEIGHLRPSGNADEFRFYAVADSEVRATEILRAGIDEPGGVVRRMERAILGGA
jgi:phosphomannomutase